MQSLTDFIVLASILYFICTVAWIFSKDHVSVEQNIFPLQAPHPFEMDDMNNRQAEEVLEVIYSPLLDNKDPDSRARFSRIMHALMGLPMVKPFTRKVEFLKPKKGHKNV